jgi:hypothetical protein
MFNDAIQLLKENQDCLNILRHYALQEKPSEEEEEKSTWTKRLYEQAEHAEENETDPSCEAHGLLIAYGYLDIELAGRDAGIHYRLSSAGKKALAQMEKQLAAQDEQRLAS